MIGINHILVVTGFVFFFFVRSVWWGWKKNSFYFFCFFSWVSFWLVFFSLVSNVGSLIFCE